MHQTTFGETHKVNIYEADNVKEFLEKCRKSFLESNLETCIYENKKIIQSKSLNFLKKSIESLVPSIPPKKTLSSK